jgi:hypothetical protein
VSAPAADKQVPAVDRRCKPPRADPSVCLSVSPAAMFCLDFFSFLNLFPSKDGVRGSMAAISGKSRSDGGARCPIRRPPARWSRLGTVLGRAGGGFGREFGIFAWFGLD